MPDALQLRYLIAVDRLTRDTYGATDGPEIVAALRADGVDVPESHIVRKMARQLEEEGWLTLYTGAWEDDYTDVQNVKLTEYGREAAREVDPFEQVASEARHMLASDGFREQYPDAFEKWEKAERALYGDDANGRLTAIGHDAREAMQAFATALVEAHNPPDVTSNVASTHKRVGAVIAMHRGRLGDARREALDALGTLWVKTDALVQRQEHGAQKEGEPITWDDARRVVFLTMFCMVELAATFEEGAPPPPPATLESGH